MRRFHQKFADNDGTTANDEEQLSLVVTETKAHSAARGRERMVKRGRTMKKAVMLLLLRERKRERECYEVLLKLQETF